jgi:hypothetical protein
MMAWLMLLSCRAMSCLLFRPWVAGIHGKAMIGTYSIVLNGGYEDDLDNGSTFLYTGSGTPTLHAIACCVLRAGPQDGSFVFTIVLSLSWSSQAVVTSRGTSARRRRPWTNRSTTTTRR